MSWKDAPLAVSSWCRRKTITHVACGGILDGRPVGAAVWGLSRAGDLLSESCVFVTQISSSAMDVAWGRSCGFGARQAWGAVQTCTWLTLPTIPPANQSRKLGRPEVLLRKINKAQGSFLKGNLCAAQAHKAVAGRDVAVF